MQEVFTMSRHLDQLISLHARMRVRYGEADELVLDLKRAIEALTAAEAARKQLNRPDFRARRLARTESVDRERWQAPT
jgi:hypothetical protein